MNKLDFSQPRPHPPSRFHLFFSIFGRKKKSIETTIFGTHLNIPLKALSACLILLPIFSADCEDCVMSSSVSVGREFKN